MPLAAAGLVTALLALPWFLWNLGVFGTPWQVSGAAKLANPQIFGHVPGDWANRLRFLAAAVWVPAYFVAGETMTVVDRGDRVPLLFVHGFPLDHGDANQVCSSCHPGIPPDYSCYGCHPKDEMEDEHQGISITDQCASCHPEGRIGR